MAVTADPAGADGPRRFVLKPAFGGHWSETVSLFRGIAVVSLGIAGVLTWLGFWPVLPFAGLELALLGWALYVSARRALDTEVVTVSEEWVCIEKGRGRPEARWWLERYFSEVCVPAPDAPGARLMIRCRGECVELGDFLAAGERRQLGRELYRCIGPVAAGGIRPAA
ncbi:DUF2244 domain-containing protein [Arhodomonas aquaeolei]|uniref:DUF2244 domain-containing protein n=1 Tax=Arhodomonas aquaeolei TaxID=2369 RepID=UPI00037ED966|nr:DUF2244 domain-containing protein [Arhodomonas aquaeolei]